MFLYDNCATRLEHFLDIFGVCCDGEVLEAVVVLVPACDVVPCAVSMLLHYDFGKSVFDVHTRPLILVIRATNRERIMSERNLAVFLDQDNHLD